MLDSLRHVDGSRRDAGSIALGAAEQREPLLLDDLR